MTDRELLELAAKAAGIQPVYCYESRRNCLRVGDKKSYVIWRPLTDDGDALRLAVKLGIDIGFGFDEQDRVVCILIDGAATYASQYENDIYFATRLAIVRAAAEIGRTTPDRTQPVEVTP